jgi:hypothetical protein
MTAREAALSVLHNAIAHPLMALADLFQLLVEWLHDVTAEAM